MKNKNGFTIVELLVSLSLTLVVVIVLFEIIILLKDLFQASSIKTEILTKKSTIVENIYNDMNNRAVVKIEQCGNYCLEFTMNDFSTKKLEVDKENLTIGYGDYVIKLDNTYSIGNVYFSDSVTNYTTTEKNNALLNIRIPIYSKTTDDENLGINIVATYNTYGMTIGKLYIVDENDDACPINTFCKGENYIVGQKLQFGGYNWHIVKDEYDSVMLLLDSNVVPNRSHIATGMTSYKWSTSYINSYLNGTFYQSLIDNKVNPLSFITNEKGICDDESGKGGNPGVLDTEVLTCNSKYTNSNVRLMSLSEYEEIKANIEENGLDSSFLYSEAVGRWALINADSATNTIVQIDTDGSTTLDSYSVLLNVRPIVIITKK